MNVKENHINGVTVRNRKKIKRKRRINRDSTRENAKGRGLNEE